MTRLRELLEEEFPVVHYGPQGLLGYDYCPTLRGFRQELDRASFDDCRDPTEEDDLRTRQIPSQFRL